MRTKIQWIIVGVLGCLLIAACAKRENPSSLQQTVDAYYAVYQQRTDFQEFLRFYADSIVLEDLVAGERVSGKPALTAFFNWDDPDFVLRDTVAFVITDQVVAGNQVVTQGYFTPFRWKDTAVEAMYFTTWLTFSKAGKISKQVDWINYPANLLDYTNRKNANNWIPGNTDD